LHFPTAQNAYPDMVFINKKTQEYIAIDFKPTYITSNRNFSGMTLGTYNRYFKNRVSQPCCKIIFKNKIKKIFYSNFKGKASTMLDLIPL